MSVMRVHIHDIWIGVFHSKREFDESAKMLEQLHSVFDWIDDRLLFSRHPYDFPAFCSACGEVTKIRLEWMYAAWSNVSPSIHPAWTETFVCQKCKLNSRMRALVDFLLTRSGLDFQAYIYIAEQLTPLYRHLRTLFPRLVGSEFLGNSYVGGRTYVHRCQLVRHEDLTRLSFESERFNAVLTLDCFEHIPNYQQAFLEIHRVLKPGGQLIFTIPFFATFEKTVVRASVTPDGKIMHHLPPEIHGNPISDEGSLCFQNFGWDILDSLRNSGFVVAEAWLYWGPWKGHLGYPTFLFRALKE